MSKAEASKHAGYVRDALDASGVPYVPEEVRRLPEVLEGRARVYDHDTLHAVRVRAEECRGCKHIVERALAAAPPGNSVPYVPEEVRRLPDGWRKKVERDVALDKGRDSTRLSCADELEAALAAAPAVCEWKYTRTSLGRDGFKGACGADWWCEEGYGPAVISDVHPYCHGCGRRIQIAAAPSDGGHDD